MCLGAVESEAERTKLLFNACMCLLSMFVIVSLGKSMYRVRIPGSVILVYCSMLYTAEFFQNIIVLIIHC